MKTRTGVLAVAAVAALAMSAALAAPAGAGSAGQQSINSLVSDARSELERMNEFGKLESQSRQLLKEHRFAEARRVALRALDLNVSNRRAKILLGDIDAAEKAAAPPSPGRSASAGPAAREPSAPRAASAGDRGGRATAAARGAVESGARGSQAVREVIRAYLGGDYAAALSASAAAGDGAPPRVWLYAACSEAALGLLDARASEQHFARARDLYAKAQASGQSFAADRQVISPRIWEVLGAP
ncbi:MAG: hypothetical protein MUF60_11650 [Vicinamibacterales bacterium]|nr:hypothetical protein [Vicinamibacterales bacterium]